MADVEEEERLLDSQSPSHENGIENGEVESPLISETTTYTVEKVYTVEEAIEKIGFGFFQVIVTLFSGLLWLADAMELMLLSVLGPAVKCQWQLSTAEEASITSVVFVGFLVGGLSWGFVSDIIGRKRGLFIIDLMLLAFGVLSAVPVSPGDDKIPGFPWLLFCRFGVGFGAGGTAQSVTYYAEFLPKRARGVCLVILEVWWAIGSMFGALLAYAVMRPGGLGWHWYLGLAAIPLALVLFFFPIVPESARFYVVKGENLKADKVMRRVAFFNLKDPLDGRIVTLEEKERIESETPTRTRRPVSSEVILYSGRAESVMIEKSVIHESEPVDKSEDSPLMTRDEDSEDDDQRLSSTSKPKVLTESSRLESCWHWFVEAMVEKFSPMLRNGMWKTTALLFFIWFVCAWLYYGVVLLTTTLLQYEPHCGIDLVSNVNCTEAELTADEYLKILWTSAAELPGLLVTVVIIEIIGRKLTMASEFLATMIAFLLLFICASPNVTTFFLFLIRAFVTGVFQAVYVYTPEVYPTSVRALAMGVHTAAARLGAIITPYMAQVLLHVSDYATIGIYSISALLVAIAALLLPIETKGRSLTTKTKGAAALVEDNTAFSVFQDYLRTLSSEHKSVDMTVDEVKDVLVPTGCDQQDTSLASPQGDTGDAIEAADNSGVFDRESEVINPTQVGQAQLNVDGTSEGRSCLAGGTKRVDEFKEETLEVKTAMERYRMEQLLLEEKLSEEIHRKEADLNAMIEESMKKKRHQEELVAERARMEDERRWRAVVTIQAGTRGYLTRKKTTPTLVALREKKRLEREREWERRRTKAATTVQAAWKGYRSRVRYNQALLERDSQLKRTHATITIQTWWRSCRAREVLKRLRREKVQEQQRLTRSQQEEDSEGKLTVSKRIQSSLSVLSQPGVSEVTCSIVSNSPPRCVAGGGEGVASSTTCTSSSGHEPPVELCYSECTSTDQRSSPAAIPKSQTFATHHPANNGAGSQRTDALGDVPENQSPVSVKQSLVSPQASTELQMCTAPISEPVSTVPISERVSLMPASGPVSPVPASEPVNVVSKLMRSLSELDRKELISELQLKKSASESVKDNRVQPSNRESTEHLDGHTPITDTPCGNSVIGSGHREQPRHATTSTYAGRTEADQTVSAPQPMESLITSDKEVTAKAEQKGGMKGERKEGRSLVLKQREEALAEEQRAMKRLVERREEEEMVAQLSRERMSSLLSVEEIAEVAKRKRSHSTYRQELEHACTPLLPHAWLGVIEERMLEWKKQHKRWTQPPLVQRRVPDLLDEIQHSQSLSTGLKSKSSVDHNGGHIVPRAAIKALSSASLSSTGRSLSDAHLLAASPRGTKLGEVACVMLYRSRGDVSIPDIGRRCPRITTMSLTKCGAMKMGEVEGRDVDGHWEMLVEINLQSNMMERVDCKSMKELRFIDLSDNRLASIHGLDNCSHLLELCLSDNRVARLSGGLPKHSGLQSLDIDGNLLINCKGLEDLPLLQRFSCAENHLPKVDGLAKCSLLQYLKLSQNNLQLYPSLCDHVLLRELFLDENSLSDITAITKSWLPLLQTLSLANNCLTELGSLTCLVMLKTLDVSNNSIYDLPLLLQGLRGCLQLQTLCLHGNPVTQESKFRGHVARAVHSLSELDGEPLSKRSKRSTSLADTVQSSPIYQLCCRQIEEQDNLKLQQQTQLEELKSVDGQTPSAQTTRTVLMTKISHCLSYERLLIQHLREHEMFTGSRNKSNKSITVRVDDETSGHDVKVKAATLIQAVVRGWLVRKKMKRMKQHKAATIIQSHYRGYLLRRRLKEILARVSFTVSEVEKKIEIGSKGDDELEFEEDVLRLDYLDETLLESDVTPLSPTDEALMEYSTSGPHKSDTNTPHNKQGKPPRSLLVPAFSLPGAAEEEVTFETWREQQQRATQHTQQTHDVIPSVPHPTTRHPEGVTRSRGESPPFRHCETDSDLAPDCVGRVQQAWGSLTQLPEHRGGRSTPDRERLFSATPDGERLSTATPDRAGRLSSMIETRKKDKIVSDWGFQSQATAELMMKRMQRQKRLQSNASRRQKLNDPGERLALFHKRQSLAREVGPAVFPTNVEHKLGHRHYSSSDPLHMKERDPSLFKWVHEQHLVHEAQGSSATKGKSSFLPSMETHVLAGHQPRLMTSAHHNEVVESSLQRSRHNVLKRTK